jgi:hypothetical protein
MTIRQLKEFIRFNNYLNIEARGLLACLGGVHADTGLLESNYP